MGFEDLNRYHDDLSRLFRDHQRALVERQFGEALFRLERYRDALLRHLGDEDRYLLPAYAAVVVDANLPRAGLFRAEHDELRDMLGDILAEFLALQVESSPDRIVRILERETRFKSFFEAHTLREKEILFPVLDSRLDTAERENLLSACSVSVGPLPNLSAGA